MKNSIYQFTCIGVLSAAVAMAQTPAQQHDKPTTPPPVVSSDTPQQNPDVMPQAPSNANRRPQAPVNPDEDKPSNTQTSTMPRGTAAAGAQSQIQDALQRQLPSAAGNVTVSIADDNSIQLTGTVTTDDQKKQAEQIAHSAAPDQTIINSLSVSGPSTGRAGASGATTASAAGETNESGQSAKLPQTDMTRTNVNGAGDAAVQSRIQAGLKAEPSLTDSSITVDTTDTSVELSGTVTSKAKKQKALDIARVCAGGRKIIDHLRVTTTSNSPY